MNNLVLILKLGIDFPPVAKLRKLHDIWILKALRLNSEIESLEYISMAPQLVHLCLYCTMNTNR